LGITALTIKSAVGRIKVIPVDFMQDLSLILAYLSPFKTNFVFSQTVPLLGIFVFGVFLGFNVKFGKSGQS